MSRAIAGIVLTSVLVCACAGHKHSRSDQSDQAMQAVRDEVSRVVPDTGRRKELHATLDRYEEELRAFDRTASVLQGRLGELNADPNASHTQFTDLITSYEVDRKATRARLLNIHQELLAHTTDEEWRSIAKREVEVLRLADAGKPR